jgi:hypothetical protein
MSRLMIAGTDRETSLEDITGVYAASGNMNAIILLFDVSFRICLILESHDSKKISCFWVWS